MASWALEYAIGVLQWQQMTSLRDRIWPDELAVKPKWCQTDLRLVDARFSLVPCDDDRSDVVDFGIVWIENLSIFK